MVGAVALVGALAYAVVSQIRVSREVRNICSQFSGINCKYHPDRYTGYRPTSSPYSLFEDEDEPEYNPWTGEYE